MLTEAEQKDTESRVLVLFPAEKEAIACQAALRRQGIPCLLCAGLPEVCCQLRAGAGAVLFSEEVLVPDESEEFLKMLASQPPWSDIPVIVLMQGSSTEPVVTPMLERIDNLTLLPRPMQTRMLLIAVRSVGRGRRRQYLIRDFLAERERAEQALRQREEQYRLALDAGCLGTWTHDLENKIFQMDAQARAMHGVTSASEIIPDAEILGRFHPAHAKRIMEVVEASHDPRHSGQTTLESCVVHPDGSTHWLAVHARTYFEGDGAQRRAVRAIGTCEDITERKQAEEALQAVQEQLRHYADNLEKAVHERTAKLQEMIYELEYFSYTIAHDMRAPLRSMQGFGEMLLKECADCLQPPHLEYIRRIADSADRLDTLLTDALSYSKVVRQEFELQPVDAAKLLRDIMNSYPQFQPPKAQVRIEGEIPTVLGNQAGLTQCFSNLLRNAVKFVQPNQVPQVRVWAEVVQRSEPTLEQTAKIRRRRAKLAEHFPIFKSQAAAASEQYLEPGKYVRLCFEDNGIGIAKCHQDLIFVMFQRLDKSYEGTGIGLALVRKVVTRMKGRVGVQSEEGKGSRFWLELRACE